MRIDFEKVLADYGLKVGDKVNVDKSLYNPYTINYIEFRGFYLISSINTFMEIQVLGISEWEKVEPKKKKTIRDLTVMDLINNCRYDERIQPFIALLHTQLYLKCNTSYFKDFDMESNYEKWIKPCIKDEILDLEVEE